MAILERDFREPRLTMPLLTSQLSSIVLLARREAEILGHDCVTPEHLLLAILWEGGGSGAGLFRDLGVDKTLAAELRRWMSDETYRCDPDALSRVMRTASEESRKAGRGNLGVAEVLTVVLSLDEGVIPAACMRLGVLDRVRKQAEIWARPHPSQVTSELVLDEDGRLLFDGDGPVRRRPSSSSREDQESRAGAQ